MTARTRYQLEQEEISWTRIRVRVQAELLDAIAAQEKRIDPRLKTDYMRFLGLTNDDTIPNGELAEVRRLEGLMAFVDKEIAKLRPAIREMQTAKPRRK